MVQAGNLTDLRWPDFSDYVNQVQKFYESYGYSLPWMQGMEPTPEAQQIIAVLLQAEQKGLSAEDYDGPRWADRVAKLKPAVTQPSEADAVRFDLALTVSVMRYISDLHIGKVNPKHFDFGLDIETKKYDLPQFVKDHLVDASDVSVVLAQVEPPYPGYQRTIRALHTYLQLAKESDAKPLPAIQKTIAPGGSYAGVPQLTRLLRLVGDLPANTNAPDNGTLYQGALVDAVKNFQRRLGREPDGRLTDQTVADLNVPLTARVRQMQLTLERWRWLPVSYQKTPLVANIPEFHLTLRRYSATPWNTWYSGPTGASPTPS
jgi:murein L,D-transpeptidase YcbB/YkuD